MKFLCSYGVNAYDYIADVLRKLASGWPQSKLDELLPWNWQPERAEKPLPADLDDHDLHIDPEELVARLGLGDKVEIRWTDTFHHFKTIILIVSAQ